MAIEYTFLMATEQDVDTTMERLAASFSLERLRENLRGPGVLLSVGTVHPRTREHYETDASIEPTISILFTLAKDGSCILGRDLMIRICTDWLTREGGDAALLQHEGGLLLLRCSGVLTINSETDWWSPEVLKLLSTAWQRGPLPEM